MRGDGASTEGPHSDARGGVLDAVKGHQEGPLALAVNRRALQASAATHEGEGTRSQYACVWVPTMEHGTSLQDGGPLFACGGALGCELGALSGRLVVHRWVSSCWGGHHHLC